MRFFLLIITIIVGATYGYGYAIVLWVVGRIVVSVIANGAEFSARYQANDSYTYRVATRQIIKVAINRVIRKIISTIIQEAAKKLNLKAQIITILCWVFLPTPLMQM